MGSGVQIRNAFRALSQPISIPHIAGRGSPFISPAKQMHEFFSSFFFVPRLGRVQHAPDTSRAALDERRVQRELVRADFFEMRARELIAFFRAGASTRFWEKPLAARFQCQSPLIKTRVIRYSVNLFRLDLTLLVDYD